MNNYLDKILILNTLRIFLFQIKTHLRCNFKL